MQNQSKNLQGQVVTDQQEFEIIKGDLKRVIILNGIYLAGILVLYFTNKNTHYLETWFAKVFHF